MGTGGSEAVTAAEARVLCGGADAPRWAIIATCRQHQPSTELERKSRKSLRRGLLWRTQEQCDWGVWCGYYTAYSATPHT